MIGVAAILVLFVGMAVAWLFGRRGRAVRAREDQLLRICRGDASRAERLIEGERARAPGISRGEAVARAVETYLRDNR